MLRLAHHRLRRYADTNLSNIALFWILCRARESGLSIDPTHVMGWGRMDARGPRRPSYHEFWGRFPLIGDLVTHFDIARYSRRAQLRHRLHESVVEAITAGAYRPMARAPDGEHISLPLAGLDVEPWTLPARASGVASVRSRMLARLLRRTAPSPMNDFDSVRT